VIKSKISGKGQITVPKEVREKLDVGYGDYIIFDTSGEDVVVRSYKKVRLTDLYGSLPATRPYPGNDEIRREVAETRSQAGYHQEKKQDD
jgi:AbrB family looped-hinge helix DNA binding protein